MFIEFDKSLHFNTSEPRLLRWADCWLNLFSCSFSLTKHSCVHRKTLSVCLPQELKFLCLIHKITSIHVGFPFIKACIKSIENMHNVNSAADASIHVAAQYRCKSLWSVCSAAYFYFFLCTSLRCFLSLQSLTFCAGCKVRILLTTVQLQYLPPKRIATSLQFSDLEPCRHSLIFTLPSFGTCRAGNVTNG